MQVSHQLRLIATILKALTAFPAVFKALTAYEALAVSAAITALIETRAIPAVEVEAHSDFFDRVIPFES